MKTRPFALLSILLAFFSQVAVADNPPAAPALANDTAPSQAVEKSPKVANPNQVNLNTATAAELQDKLVGIGAKKAQAIVDYREKHGKFIRLEQFTEVQGIGKATLEKNRDRLVLE